jgi:hypothetical protein
LLVAVEQVQVILQTITLVVVAVQEVFAVQ